MTHHRLDVLAAAITLVGLVVAGPAVAQTPEVAIHEVVDTKPFPRGER